MRWILPLTCLRVTGTTTYPIARSPFTPVTPLLLGGDDYHPGKLGSLMGALSIAVDELVDPDSCHCISFTHLDTDFSCWVIEVCHLPTIISFIREWVSSDDAMVSVGKMLA